MARQSMVAMVNAIRTFNPADKKTFFDLFTALREAIAPVNTSLVGSLTTDVASIATGAQATAAITVTGAAIGDYVQVQPSVAIGALSISAMVTAANTVTMVLANNSGGAIDPPNATYQAVVTPRAAYAKAGNFAA